MLGNAVLPRLQHLYLHFIFSIRQFVHQSDQQRSTLCLSEVRNVLEDHCPGIQTINYGKETAPEVGPFVVGVSAPSPDEVTDLRGTSRRERLTWRATSNQVHGFDAPIVQAAEELCGTGKIPRPCKTLKVRSVSLGRHWVGISGGDH